MREATALPVKPAERKKGGSAFEKKRNPATNASGTNEAAVQITAGPIWSGSNPWMARPCGTKRIVVTRKKRKKKSPVPSRIVSLSRRYGMSTRGLGPSRRRTRAHNKRNEPLAKSAVNTPECHQSSLSPCSHAAKTNAKPALAYKNPAKLGASPCSFAGGDFGMPR